MQFVIFLNVIGATSQAQDPVCLKQERRYPRRLIHSHSSPYFIIIIEQGLIQTHQSLQKINKEKISAL